MGSGGYFVDDEDGFSILCCNGISNDSYAYIFATLSICSVLVVYIKICLVDV